LTPAERDFLCSIRKAEGLESVLRILLDSQQTNNGATPGKLTPEVKARIFSLREQGKTAREIADVTGRSRTSIDALFAAERQRAALRDAKAADGQRDVRDHRVLPEVLPPTGLRQAKGASDPRIGRLPLVRGMHPFGKKRKPRRPITPREESLILSLTRAGKSIMEISDQVERSETGIRYVLERNGLQPQKKKGNSK